MFRSALFVVFLSACSNSGLGSYQAAVEAQDSGWRTLAEHVAVDAYGTYIDIEVPAGATFLEVRIGGSEGVVVDLVGPEGQNCAAEDDGHTWNCRVDGPAAGTWMLGLRRTEGASTVAVEWEFGGAEQEDVVLVRQAFSGEDASFTLVAPDALGTLEAVVEGESAGARVSGAGLDYCTGSPCEAHFPQPGSLTVQPYAAGSGELTVTWRPATLLVDTWIEQGVQNLPFAVSEGTPAVAVRATGAERVRLMRGQFELCSGVSECVVEQPAAGDWVATVDVTADESVVVKVGAVGGPDGGADTGEPTDHGDTFETATVLEDFGTVDARMEPGDVDVFRLDAQGGGFLSSSGPLDVKVHLYQANGRLLASDDDSGSGTNFRIRLPEDAVYASVEGHADRQTGAYTLTYVAPAMVINEVMSNASAFDANCDGSIDQFEDEFVELVNPGTESVDLSNWTLSDLQDVRFRFPAVVIPPGRRVVVFGGGTPGCTPVNTVVFVARLDLGNNGDQVVLHDDEGVWVDAVGWVRRHHQSLTREQDGEPGSPFVPHGQVGLGVASPGTAASL